MRVMMGAKAYSATRSQAEHMVALASELVPHGVYALVKPGTVMLMNDRLDPADVPAAVEKWESHGWEVRYNA